MQVANFELQGMNCGGCVRHVTGALQRVDGVQVKNVVVGSAEVEYDPRKTSPGVIAAAVSAAGYPTSQSDYRKAESGQCGGGGCCAR